MDGIAGFFPAFFPSLTQQLCNPRFHRRPPPRHTLPPAALRVCSVTPTRPESAGHQRTPRPHRQAPRSGPPQHTSARQHPAFTGPPQQLPAALSAGKRGRPTPPAQRRPRRPSPCRGRFPRRRAALGSRACAPGLHHHNSPPWRRLQEPPPSRSAGRCGAARAELGAGLPRGTRAAGGCAHSLTELQGKGRENPEGNRGAAGRQGPPAIACLGQVTGRAASGCRERKAARPRSVQSCPAPAAGGRGGAGLPQVTRSRRGSAERGVGKAQGRGRGTARRVRRAGGQRARPAARGGGDAPRGSPSPCSEAGGGGGAEPGLGRTAAGG